MGALPDGGRLEPLAPTWEWVRQAGGTNAEWSSQVAVDSSGNIYVLGHFDWCTTLGTNILIGAGERQPFLAKYDPAGHLLWARGATGTDYIHFCRMGLDAAGQVYVHGEFRDQMQIGPHLLTSAPGVYTIFVVKYDTDGNVLWARQADINDWFHDYEIPSAVDAEGHVYLTGYFYGTANFGSVTLQSDDPDSGFLVKYDRDGNVVWAQERGGIAKALAVDPSGNVYLTGLFVGSARFGDHLLESRAGDYHTFVVKYDPAGTVLWAVASDDSDWSDEGTSLAADKDGNVFVTGTFNHSLAFDGQTVTRSQGGPGLFAAKFDALGRILWLRSAAHDTGDDAVRGMAVNPAGHLVIAGNFAEGTVNFGDYHLTNAIGQDAFLVEYDGSGDVLGARQFWSDGWVFCTGLVLDPLGQSYVWGQAAQPVHLESFAVPATAIWLAKLDASGNALWFEKIAAQGMNILAYGYGDSGGNFYLTGCFSGTQLFGTNALISAGQLDFYLAKLAAPPSPPIITVQPVSQTTCSGGTATFTVGAAGTLPLLYQWWFNGHPFNGATNAVLTLHEVGLEQTGTYVVVVSNAAGSVTSAWASLTVLSSPVIAWSTSEDFPWTVTEHPDGSYAAAPPTIMAWDSTWLEGVVQGPGVLSFWWRVESDPSHCCDKLRFYLGAEFKASISGTTAYRQRTFSVPYGEQRLRWEYTTGRDDEGYPGSGGLWNIRFTPQPPTAPELVTPLRDQTIWAGDDVRLALEVSGTEPFMCQWTHDGTALAVVTGPTLLLTNADYSAAGLYTVVISNAWGTATSAATLTVEPPGVAWDLVRREGGTNRYASGGSAAADYDGNVYQTGLYLDTARFGSCILTNAGSFDIFLVKYDATGSALWAQRVGGPSWDSAGDVAVDSAGNVYLTGAFDYWATLADQTLSNAAQNALFLAKYDRVGNLLWARQSTSSAGSSAGRYLVVDGAGDVSVAGDYSQSLALGTHMLTGSGLFHAKFDPAGTVLALQRFDTSVPPFGSYTAFASDASGNFYLADRFFGVETFGSQRLTNDDDYSDFFLAKFDPAGNALWAVQGAAGEFADVSTTGVAADTQGDVFLAGTFWRDITIGTHELRSQGDPDVFVAKYDSGGQLLWVKQIGSPNDDFARIAVSATDELHLCGRGEGLIHLDNHIVIGTPSASYLAKLDAAGEVLWVQQPVLESSAGFSVALGPAGQLYALGSFTNSVRFGTNILTSTSPRDFYLAKLVELPSNLLPPTIATQPQSQARFVGQNATFTVAANATLPLSYQWLFNGAPIPGTINATLTLTNVQLDDAGGYAVVVSNPAGSVTSLVATLTVLPVPTGPGSLDLTFDVTDGGQLTGLAGSDPAIEAMIQQPDGKILIAGCFTGLYGQPRHKVARLNADLTLDGGFDPGWGANDTVTALELAPDGKVIVAGKFTEFAGQPRRHLARLHPNGSLDTAFRADLGLYNWIWIQALAVQDDGKVLVGGSFTNVNGVPWTNLARLNLDGSLDPSFQPQPWFDHQLSVANLKVLPDGKILALGRFGTTSLRVVRLHADGRPDTNFVCGLNWRSTDIVSRLGVQSDGKIVVAGMRMARLFPDGRLDTSFAPSLSSSSMLDMNPVKTMAFQPDGKIVIGGDFTRVLGVERRGVARLNADGTLDPSFDPGNAVGLRVLHAVSQNPEVNALLLLADGRLLVGAHPNTGADITRSLIRLERNGSLETSFTPGVEADEGEEETAVYALTSQPDGKVLIGGTFTSVNSAPAPGVARLNADGTLDRGFRCGSTIGPIVRAIALQPDGKVVIGGGCWLGWFGEPAAFLRFGIARLNPDGSVDPTFDPAPRATGGPPLVRALAIQPDGKILAGGEFSSLYDNGPAALARLNPNGTPDTGFTPPALAAGDWWGVYTIALQPDGRIIIGGDFGAHWSLARLEADGSRDGDFLVDFGGSCTVFSVRVLADGKILVAGNFQTVNGATNRGVARLNPDGSLDASFVADPGLDATVFDLAVQPDGKILAVADRWIYGSGGGVRHEGGVARLHPNGSLDSTFLADALDTYTLALQTDGQVLIGGAFDTVNGFPCRRIARLHHEAWPHPADVEAPQWNLSISEITAYGAAWRRGETWPLPPNPIPIDYVTRAAALWRGGECYRFNDRTNAPLWWVNCESLPGVSPTPGEGKEIASASQTGRRMPAVYVPGEPLTITISTTPGSDVRAYAVEDAIPTSWTVAAITEGGEFDTVSGQVKWGPFLDNAPRTLAFQVTPPTTASGPGIFAGVVSFDGVNRLITGNPQLCEACRVVITSPPASGQLRLTLFGRLGAQFVIEASTDLVHWTPIETATNTVGRVEFNDPDYANFRHRFYRANRIE